MTAPFALVVDFDDRVTWRAALLQCAAEAGVPVVASRSAAGSLPRVYPADDPSLTTRANGDYYLLCATAVQPSDAISDDELEREIATIHWADGTFVVSNAELTKLLSALPAELLEKVVVTGFPQPWRYLEQFCTANKRDAVCFASDDRPVKNPALELEAARLLVASGFEVVRFAPGRIARRREWTDAGVHVVEQISGAAFFEQLATFRWYVATSMYEALCTTAQQAAFLGVIPIVPDHSGFRDWCSHELRYAYDGAASILRCIMHAPARVEIDLERYAAHAVFGRMAAVIEEHR